MIYKLIKLIILFKMLKEMVLKIDLFGHEYNFETKGSPKHKSIEGGIISIICIVAIIAISFIFGQDLYLRKNPQTSRSQDIRPNVPISMSKFPYMISIIGVNGEIIENFKEYIDFEIYKFAFNEKIEFTIDATITMDNCKNQLDYYEGFAASAFKQIVTNAPYIYNCFNFKDHKNKLEVKNEYTSPNSEFIRFKIIPCYNSINPTIKQKCKIKKGEKFPIDLKAGFIYFQSFLNFEDYLEPVRHKYIGTTVSISPGSTNIFNFEISNDIFSSDNGWLLSGIKTYDYYGVSSLKIFFVTGTEEVYEATFFSTTVRNTTTRRYMKIQELLASIGGFANTIIMAMSIILSNFVRFNYLSYIHSSTFEHIIHENEKLKSEIKTCIEASNLKLNFPSGNLKVQSNKVSDLNIKNNDQDIVKVSPFKSQNNKTLNLNIEDDQIELPKNLRNYDKFNKLIGLKPDLIYKTTQANNLFANLDYSESLASTIVDKKFKLLYCTYLNNNLFCHKDKVKQTFYQNEIKRVEQLMDFTTLNQYLIQQYAIKYTN